MAAPASPMLSASQISRLAEVGEERTAAAGDVLYTIGDRSYPLIAIREGEAAILDGAGNEIVRHGPGGFLGELNLLSGQTVFVTAVAMQPLRYVAVEREALRALLFEDGPLSDLLLSSFIARREALQTVQGSGSRSSGRTRPRRRCACSTSRAATACRSPGRTRARRRRGASRAPPGRCGATVAVDRRGPAGARGRARARSPRGGRPAGRRSGPGRTRRRGLRRVRGPLDARGRGDCARRTGRLLAPDRELPRLSRPASAGPSSPAGQSRRRGSSARVRRRPIARSRSSPARNGTWSVWTTIARSHARTVLIATGAQYRRLPVDGPLGLRGPDASSTRRARRRHSSAAPRGSVLSAEATPPARLPSGSRGAARWSRFSTGAATCRKRCRTT